MPRSPQRETARRLHLSLHLSEDEEGTVLGFLVGAFLGIDGVPERPPRV